MTRITKLYSLVTILLLLFSTASQANSYSEDERIVRSNWANPMSEVDGAPCISMGPNNQLIISLSVRTAVNDLENYPPMYVSYNWNDVLTGTSDQITSADLRPSLVNGYFGYTAEIIFTLTLDGLCQNNPPSTLIDFNFSYALITKTPFTTAFYPVTTYPVLFPSLMFPDILEPNFSPTYIGYKALCCEDTQNQSYTSSGEETSTIHTDRGDNNQVNEYSSVLGSPYATETPNAAIDQVLLSPNPANELVNVDFVMNEPDRYRIDILDLNGKVLRSINKSANYAGRYQETINIADLVSGIYICTVQSDTTSQSFKLIKL